MKALLISAICLSFVACDSKQKGEGNYTDSADAKMDTTLVPHTTTPSDSAMQDSTVKDSTYHK